MKWICTKCHTTAISKCPDERSVFLEDEKLAMCNNTTAVHVIDLEDCMEVSLLTTVYGSSNRADALGAAIKNISHSAGHLVTGLCNHDFVLAEGTECQLGHTHRNISEYAEDTPEPRLSLNKSVRVVLSAISTLVAQYRKALNRSKDTFDYPVEAGFDKLMEQVRTELYMLADGRTNLPPFKVCYSGGSDLGFTDLKAAFAAARGLIRGNFMTGVYALNELGRYTKVEFKTTTCAYCCKPLQFLDDNGEGMHEACVQPYKDSLEMAWRSKSLARIRAYRLLSNQELSAVAEKFGASVTDEKFWFYGTSLRFADAYSAFTHELGKMLRKGLR